MGLCSTRFFQSRHRLTSSSRSRSNDFRFRQERSSQTKPKASSNRIKEAIAHDGLTAEQAFGGGMDLCPQLRRHRHPHQRQQRLRSHSQSQRPRGRVSRKTATSPATFGVAGVARRAGRYARYVWITSLSSCLPSCGIACAGSAVPCHVASSQAEFPKRLYPLKTSLARIDWFVATSGCCSGPVHPQTSNSQSVLTIAMDMML